MLMASESSVVQFVLMNIDFSAQNLVLFSQYLVIVTEQETLILLNLGEKYGLEYTLEDMEALYHTERRVDDIKGYEKNGQMYVVVKQEGQVAKYLVKVERIPMFSPMQKLHIEAVEVQVNQNYLVIRT